MNMKAIVATALVAVLTACAPMYPEYVPDQTLRREIFKECMAALPEGPKSTQYNDWDEVVEECDSVAYRQSQVCVANCPDTRPAAVVEQP